MASKPRLGVYKLASCDGCQLTLLDCEDEFLAVVGAVEIVSFAEATSREDDGGPLDVVLVEGSVSAPEHREQLLSLRARAKKLITIGACATSGGLQALRNFADHQEYLSRVYAHPEYIHSLDTSTPISAHVPVDFELRGCPIDKGQLLEVLTALLVGRAPQLRDESVCMECKRAGHVCVMVTGVEPCLGPVTHSGCGAICPGMARGCFGCFGPKESGLNTHSLAEGMAAQGQSPAQIQRRFRGITGWAPPFRTESERHGG
jgi:coenzyme F420-reducing hydrogenase gamma subunit